MTRLARLAFAAAVAAVALPAGFARAEDPPVVTAPPVVVTVPDEPPVVIPPVDVVTVPDVPPPTTEPAPYDGPVVMPNFPPPTTVPDTDDRCLPQGTTRLTVMFCTYVPAPTAVASAPAERHAVAAHQPAAPVRLSLLVLRWGIGVGGALGSVA